MSSHFFFYILIIHPLSIFINAFISISHISNTLVPYGYALTLSYACILLSSLLLIAILFIFSVYIV